MRHTLLTSILSLSLLCSASAFAAGMQTGTETSIKALPSKGKVQIQGMVQNVIDRDTFLLRDTQGQNIRVHTQAKADVKAGEMVTVAGTKGMEAGSANIRNASINVVQKPGGDVYKQRMGSDNTHKHADRNQFMAAAQSQHERSELANPVPKDARNSFRTHRATYGSEMWERNKEYREEGVNAVAQGNPAYYHKNSIEALPRHGTVTLTGVVDKIRNDRTFILRDSHGETIDVHTMTQARLSPGDAVNVNGNVNSEILGFGREIENAQVSVISQNR